MDNDNTLSLNSIEDIPFPSIITDLDLNISDYNKEWKKQFDADFLTSHMNLQDYFQNNLRNIINNNTTNYCLGYSVNTKLNKQTVCKIKPTGKGHYIWFFVQIPCSNEKSRVENNFQHCLNFLENTNDIIWTMNLEGKMTYVSPSVVNFLGYTVQEHMNQHFTDYMTKDSIEMVMQKLSTLMEEVQKGKPRETDEQKIFQIEFIRKDGSHGWAEVKTQALRDQKDNVIGINGVTSDITDRKINRDALQASEEKYRLLVENSSELIVKINKKAEFQFISSSFCEKFGVEEEKVIQSSFGSFVSTQAQITIDKLIESLIYPPHSYYFEDLAATKDGERWISWSFKAVLDAENNIDFFIGVGRDIHKQKLSEKALIESESRYRTLAENSVAGITIGDNNDQITYVNKSFCDLTGYSSDELKTMHYKDLIHYDDINIYELERNKRKKGENSVYQSRIVGKNGKISHVLISACPLFDKDLKLIENMAVLVDISRLKETEEKLKEADKLKTAFLANMSHEIRNPMNGIIGFADLLRFPDLSEEQKNEYVDLITNSCRILLNLIEDIIDISKIEAGQLQIKKTDTYINDIMRELFKHYKEKQVQDEKEHIMLNLELGNDSSDFKIFTDGFRLRQILLNLIDNAFKFTKEGSINYGYHIKKEYIEFFVKDSGIGLPEDKVNMIFDRFRQVDEDTAIRKFGGAGLGLSISKSLVELLGGNITVESELHKGTQFKFTIPYVIATSTDSEKCISKNSKHTEYCWKDKTILIAEDEQTNYIFLEKVLKNTEVNILWVKNGLEAINSIKNNPEINLVLLDIKMPVMSGYEAVVKIKEIRPEIPVIAQTAYAMAEEKEKSIQLGCDDYLTKPIKSKSLLLAISNYFETQS
ncbi:MAG: hypothetical protein C0594_11825 [Marinilabiliales bacterium]|nr:MAG: hypothetical protein C0594_11825 [Marinilabiliales bacterium]